ncbi:peroxiredoxin-like family protein [Rubinisphaera margarita]|uniref:peroxiredoxin-like family protein n=1 Tax=Rubinisphaera margarita TaxID=2909586 RepID=UPI001EE8017E|nr:peroxiredoxin-like family protein [Rubinisphaera margarita]MCG6155890.1 AhpC/TSA family protein [Rubinisphaera margarita]
MIRCQLMVIALFAAVCGFASVGWAEQITIAGDAEATKPLKAGEKVPDVTVQNGSGESVSLRSLVDDGPTVIVFFRGSWCPICTRHFADLIKIHPEIVEQGGKVIAISPDTAELSSENEENLGIPFELYSDSDVKAASAFGLAFQVDDATLTRYEKFGIDLEKASGRSHHALPVPAVFIVGDSGTIRFAHSDPDYRQRLEGKKIVAELKELQ